MKLRSSVPLLLTFLFLSGLNESTAWAESRPSAPSLCINSDCSSQGNSELGIPLSVNKDHFHPGHYAMEQGRDASGLFSLVKNEPNIIGVLRCYQWADLEPAPGVYDFTRIRDDIATLSAMKKQLMLCIRDIRFTYKTPFTPSWMHKDPNYGALPPKTATIKGGNEKHFYGSYWKRKNDGSIKDSAPALWNENVISHFEALCSALGKEFGNNLTVEGIHTSESALSLKDAKMHSDFDRAAFERNYIRSVEAMKKAFPNRQVFVQANFNVTSKLTATGIQEWAVSNGIGLAFPDTLLDERGGYLTPVYDNVRKYRLAVPTSPHVEYSNWGKKNKYPSAKALLDFSIARFDPWYIVWNNDYPMFRDKALPAIRAQGQLPAAQAFYERTRN